MAGDRLRRGAGDARARPRARGAEPGGGELLAGWGRAVASRATVVAPGSAEEVAKLLAQAPPRGTIPRGLGRSYGDAAQNAGGQVLATRRLSGVVGLDAAAGTVTARAGTSLDTLLRIVAPLGWVPFAIPGTRFVTVGGAVASDVHGKNHHADGGFADHLVAFELVTPAGNPRTVTPGGDPDVFWATAGGMGLTGVVTAATLRLLPVETTRVRADTDRVADLDDCLARMAEGDRRHRFSAAWVDLLAGGRALGRAVLTRGEFALRDELPRDDRPQALALAAPGRLAAPPWVPSGLLNTVTARAFNEAWFRRAPRREHGRLVGLHSFFTPLDGVAGWNRLYGPRGFVQYQFLVPFGRDDALRGVVERLRRARCPSFLAVLKRLRPQAGLLSFPRPGGWTLALDIPARVPGLARLLDELDELVAAAGGRVYLSKDARLRPDLLAAMYPELTRWRAVRDRLDPDGVMTSDLARRL
ncbi:MAG TPA: FAD-binding oxidoreductase, partial [Actinomycetes bacterium]|nr:FAD-binding oxidoreductase [Actinomycetes bacterium]